MSASRIFIQLAVAALIGSVMTSDPDVYWKCFGKLKSYKGDVCPLTQGAIKCYAMNFKGEVSVEDQKRNMKSIESDFEKWGCAGKENIRIDVCKNMEFPNDPKCQQELYRQTYLARFMEDTKGKTLSAIQKQLTKYRQDIRKKCRDYTEKKVDSYTSFCAGQSLKNKKSDCNRASYFLDCFISNSWYKDVLPTFYAEEQKAISKVKTMVCSANYNLEKELKKMMNECTAEAEKSKTSVCDRFVYSSKCIKRITKMSSMLKLLDDNPIGFYASIVSITTQKLCESSG